MNARFVLAVMACGALGVAGCNSISSTALNRTDGDIFVGTSNGSTGPRCITKPFKGVPITVRVPTHVDIVVKEKVDLYYQGGELSSIKPCRRTLFVEAKLIQTEKVFTVDINRPFSGDADYTLDFDPAGKNPQYFTQVKAKIVDTTIQDVNTALSTLMPLLSGNRTSADGGGDSGTELAAEGTVIPEVRTVAWKRFDLNSPSLQCDVGAFVGQHLNCDRNCYSKDVVRPDRDAGKSNTPPAGKSGGTPADPDVIIEATPHLLPEPPPTDDPPPTDEIPPAADGIGSVEVTRTPTSAQAWWIFDD